MTGTSSPENLQDVAVDTLRFDTLRVAVVWHLERPAVPWPLNKQEIIKLRRESTEPICERPVTYYPSSELGENASTRRADVAAAALDWLDDMGVRREWLRAEDPQSEKSVAERDRLLDKRYVDKDDLEFILAKIRELDTDKDPAEQLDDFLKHMLVRCPWLEHEWPGATISASASEPSSPDAAGSPADTGGCTTTIDRTGEKILNVLAELPAAVCQSLVSAPPAEQPGATIEPDATVPARTAAPVIDAEAKPAPLEQPLPPCQLTAHQSYVRAHENNSELKGATLPEVHTWLSKHDPDPDYQLPRFQTWGRYIRAVKRHRRGCPANAPRAGRAHGSSIASHDQVSDRRIPTG